MGIERQAGLHPLNRKCVVRSCQPADDLQRLHRIARALLRLQRDYFENIVSATRGAATAGAFRGLISSPDSGFVASQFPLRPLQPATTRLLPRVPTPAAGKNRKSPSIVVADARRKRAAKFRIKVRALRIRITTFHHRDTEPQRKSKKKACLLCVSVPRGGFFCWTARRCVSAALQLVEHAVRTSHFEVSGTSTTSLCEMMVTALRSSRNQRPRAKRRSPR